MFTCLVTHSLAPASWVEPFLLTLLPCSGFGPLALCEDEFYNSLSFQWQFLFSRVPAVI